MQMCVRLKKGRGGGGAGGGVDLIQVLFFHVGLYVVALWPSNIYTHIYIWTYEQKLFSFPSLCVFVEVMSSP